METDTLRRDLALLLLALTATVSFASYAAGHAGTSAFFTGLLAATLDNRYWKRERNGPGRPARRRYKSPTFWHMIFVLIVAVIVFLLVKRVMPGLSASMVCAVTSAVEAATYLRWVLTPRRTTIAQTAI